MIRLGSSLSSLICCECFYAKKGLMTTVTENCQNRRSPYICRGECYSCVSRQTEIIQPLTFLDKKNIIVQQPRNN